MKLTAAVLLACLPSSAFAATTMSIAKQNDGPVQIQTATYGLSDALESAVFTNRSGKAITAYRIGWISVVKGKAEVHQGAWMNTPGGIASGTNQAVPAQGIPINMRADTMTFFVSSVSYADGSKWSAHKGDLLKQSFGSR